MEKVVFTRGTLVYFDDLVYTLFSENYFSFEENAQNYVDKIVNYIIIKEIDSFPQKTTPKKLRALGSFYIFYKANKRTTWFMFFEKKKGQYLVASILNNYCKEVGNLS